MKPIAHLLAGASLVATVSAGTTIDEANKYAYGANIGWINCRDANGGADGAVIGEYVCSGWLWAANVGWICLGDGTPANGIHYSNTSATDFGVNHDGTGLLRGFAYGANIGWINFEATGNPHLDFTTGRFNGCAWSANCGWINLGDGTFLVRTNTVTPSPDSDNDGIADAWEYSHAGPGNLAALGATPAADADGDGASDVAEYGADTDPFSQPDRLRICSFVRTANGSQVLLCWTSRRTRHYRIMQTQDLPAPWTTALDDIEPDAATTTTRALPLPPVDPRCFFCIQAFRPLAP